MLKKRIIPCLDVKNGRVVKGIKFRNHVDMGDPAELAEIYSRDGADELVFYDITASPEDRDVDIEWVKRVAKKISIPFSVAGGIRSLETAKRVLGAGADKISINTPALTNPDLINELVSKLGTQCVVIGIDCMDGKVYQNTGDPSKTSFSERNLIDWVREVEKRGAGEIVLNSMNKDGVKNGYDIETLNIVCNAVTIPVIASGGAGIIKHFLEVFQRTSVTGALAASVFHSGEIKIIDLKKYLDSNGINVRV